MTNPLNGFIFLLSTEKKIVVVVLSLTIKRAYFWHYSIRHGDSVYFLLVPLKTSLLCVFFGFFSSLLKAGNQEIKLDVSMLICSRATHDDDAFICIFFYSFGFFVAQKKLLLLPFFNDDRSRLLTWILFISLKKLCCINEFTEDLGNI